MFLKERVGENLKDNLKIIYIRIVQNRERHGTYDSVAVVDQNPRRKYKKIK